MDTPEILALEHRTRRQSAAITTAIMLVFFFVSWAFRGFSASAPEEIGNGGYEMVGAIDFGDGKIGSGDINNFHEASANATGEDKPASQAAPVTQPSDQLTQDAPSPVSEPAKPQQQQPNPNAPVYQPTTPGSPGGGSNHGDAQSGVGNAGLPSVQKLDPNGLYSFTEGGSGGLNGRKAIELPYPKYDVQEEGTIYFEFRIAPDGTVEYVGTVGLSTKQGLVRAGKEAIYQWVFTPLSRDVAQVGQTVRVKITFKLKN